MGRQFRTTDEYEKELFGIVDKLCYTRQRWQVWEDLMTAIACSISNSTDRNPERYERREKAFRDAIGRIGSMELAAKALGVIVNALEANPHQDFLGNLYMNLELGSHWHGQFFTPYSLCEMTATMQMQTAPKLVEQNGWISVCDPAIGGGAMLIAAANCLKLKGINYQERCVFVGQDIDSVAGMMAYIQLSLLGCPGYIVIANTLTNPVTGRLLMPNELEGQDFWYTPFFFTDVWEMRRRLSVMDAVLRNAKEISRNVDEEDVEKAGQEIEGNPGDQSEDTEDTADTGVGEIAPDEQLNASDEQLNASDEQLNVPYEQLNASDEQTPADLPEVKTLKAPIPKLRRPGMDGQMSLFDLM